MNHRIDLSIALATVLFFGSSQTSLAQLDLGKWQVGLNGGMLIYQGDLTPSPLGSYKTLRPVVGLNVSRVLNSSFLLRANLAVGALAGNDSLYSAPTWRKERNYKFTTPVTEVSGLLVWNMFSNNGNELGQRFSPYMFAGLGVNFLHIKRDYSLFNQHYFASATKLLNGLNADAAITPPGATLVLPMGIGMEVYLTPKLSLTGETNFRYTFSDYLDGFSLGANPDRNDFYHSHTVGILYRFGKGNRLGCPVMKP